MARNNKAKQFRNVFGVGRAHLCFLSTPLLLSCYNSQTLNNKIDANSKRTFATDRRYGNVDCWYNVLSSPFFGPFIRNCLVYLDGICIFMERLFGAVRVPFYTYSSACFGSELRRTNVTTLTTTCRPLKHMHLPKPHHINSWSPFFGVV